MALLADNDRCALNRTATRTQAFLTGTLQNFARRHGHPIDTVSFEHQVMDQGPPRGGWEAPEDGCYVHGMFMEGARWDSKEHALGEQWVVVCSGSPGMGVGAACRWCCLGCGICECNWL